MFEEHSILEESGELPSKGKLQWNCRRGMKELEVLLLPFLEHCFDDFPDQKQQQFVHMLGFDDASLYAWFMGYEKPEQIEIENIIREVQDAVANLHNNQSSAANLAE